MNPEERKLFKTTSLKVEKSSFHLAMSTFEMAADIESRCIPAATRLSQGFGEAADGGNVISISTCDTAYDGGDYASV